MGFADLLLQQVVWSLVSFDDGTEIEGQFPAQNVRENISGVWAQQGTFGLSQPILQFVRGELETIELDVKVWAKHQGLLGTGAGADNIFDVVEEIRGLPRADPDLGRPHVWLFTIGTLFNSVVVQSVGGIRYDRFRPKDGTIRGVSFSLRLLKYVQFDVKDLTGQAVVESLVTPARPGEAYEHITKRVHGDALLGESLRRRNPDRRTLTAGDLVHVPSKRNLRREVFPLTPQSLFLKTGDRQRDNIVDAFNIRGAPALSHVVLDDFGG